MTMTLSSKLLGVHADSSASNDEFKAQVDGLYHPQRFVLELSPEIHRSLSNLPSGIITGMAAGWEGVQAMSTYLHETVHWWQHIGSTHGFISSLNFPVQAHSTLNDLHRLLQADGFKKSVYLQSIELSKTGADAGVANRIVNNHFDLLAFRRFTWGPESAEKISQQPLFEAIGHALYMTYGHTIHALASTVDRDFSALPDPSLWESSFGKLREDKFKGHYYGSPVDVWPLGAYEILEGQARFSQIQYLSQSSNHKLHWNDLRSMEMLNGVYVKAFEWFLRYTDSEWPRTINDPLVGLFLLVCDLACNPGSGFPFPPTANIETFINDVNPGARFCIFCRVIATFHPDLKRAIRNHSRSEYKFATELVCKTDKEFSPLMISKICSLWFGSDGQLSALRKEYDSYNFGHGNFLFRHLFAHFLAFQEDKNKRPEFFCWPGAWMAGPLLDAHSLTLFDKHGAVFVNREENDGVFAKIQKNRDPARVEETYNSFYQNQVLYSLVDQWISKAGKFSYDYSWLTETNNIELNDFVDRQFEHLFGVKPGTATLLKT